MHADQRKPVNLVIQPLHPITMGQANEATFVLWKFLHNNFIKMSNTTELSRKDEVTAPTAQGKTQVENHKTAAKHHDEASKHHIEAANHREAGDHVKANASTLKAQGHSAIANDHHTEITKQQALNSQK